MGYTQGLLEYLAKHGYTEGIIVTIDGDENKNGTEVSIYALNDNVNLEKLTEGMQRSIRK